MTSLRPPAKFKRRISDLEATRRAEAVMTTDLGQRAIRGQWARGLYQYVIMWGKPPDDLWTIDALKRQANEFLWNLADRRKAVDPKDPLKVQNLKFMEGAEAFEAELRRRFLKKDAA